jgi:hypothetical protein
VIPFVTGELITNPTLTDWQRNLSIEVAPEVDPKGVIEWHDVPTDFYPFYQACNYYTVTTDYGVCVDGLADVVGGDPTSTLGRQEIKQDWIRGNGSYQHFCDGRPCFGGLESLVAHALPDHTGVTCEITLDVQLWTNPVFGETPPYNIIEWSKPRYNAENDDLRATEFMVFAANNRYLRNPSFVSEVWFGDPSGESWLPHPTDNPFYRYVGVELADMPYDRWEQYTVDLYIPPGQQDLWFGFAALNRFGWGMNVYVRNFSVVCSGESTQPFEPTPEFQTPTPIATAVPTVTEEPTPTPNPTIRPVDADINVVQVVGNFFPAITFATFSNHVVDWSTVVRQDIPAGNPMPIAAYYKDPITGERWFASDGYWDDNPDGYEGQVWFTSEWYPWYADSANWAGLTGFRWFGYPIVEGEIPDLPLE